MIDTVLTSIAGGEEYQAARVLSIAMLANPIHVAVLGGHGDVERRYLEAMFSGMLKHRPGDVLLMKHRDTIVGVLRSYACHGTRHSYEQASHHPEVDDPDLRDIDARIQYWTNAWDQRDPVETHRHLGPLGVLPQFQGLGLGSGMLERFCAQVDANNEAAFLETDTLTNVTFYENFRFRTIGEKRIFGVKCFFMWRPAQR